MLDFYLKNQDCSQSAAAAAEHLQWLHTQLTLLQHACVTVLELLLCFLCFMPFPRMPCSLPNTQPCTCFKSRYRCNPQIFTKPTRVHLLLQQQVGYMVHPGPPPPATLSATFLWGLAANGLMVPRAYLQREVMWFTGTCTPVVLALVTAAAAETHQLGLLRVVLGRYGAHS